MTEKKPDIRISVGSLESRIQEACLAISQKSSLVPRIGIVLGSGLSDVGEELAQQTLIPYSDIPHFHTPSIPGHQGQLVLGRLQGTPVLLLKGRYHFYEGYSMEEVAFPTRVAAALGIQTLVLTNAAGGVNTRFRPGEVMLIEDHLNLMADNPLIGRGLSHLGPRFPDMTEAYDRSHLAVLRRVAEELKIAVHSGVYAGLSGPCYETPAEVRMLRNLGADAVGMSTVPETIAARHLGLKVVGLSCITNLAAGMTKSHLSHQEVIEVSKIGAEKIQKLLRSAIPQWA